MARAEALRVHAKNQANDLRKDLFRAAWMFGVGAVDAYFSDAYADMIARTLRARDQQPSVRLPNRLNNLKLPVIAMIRRSHSWRWRMAARELIEEENVLSVTKIKELFNQFFEDGNKVVSQNTIEPWILHPDANTRLFGVTATSYCGHSRREQDTDRKQAVRTFIARMSVIFQRRHDCIHNCDRPKIRPQKIGPIQTRRALSDLCFLVERLHDAFVAEFPAYLARLGFNGTVRNRVTR